MKSNNAESPVAQPAAMFKNQNRVQSMSDSGDGMGGAIQQPSGRQAGLMQSAGRWWKEPMMWLVVGLPASVVVAGVWTVILASRSMP